MDYPKKIGHLKNKIIEKSKVLDLTSTASSKTIVEKRYISPSINDKTLRVSLNRYFNTSANKKLEKIFEPTTTKSVKCSQLHKRSFTEEYNPSSDIIMDEFSNIKNQRI